MSKRKKTTGRALDGVAVLVVEDHPPSARMLSALLTAAGADVKTVEDAESAVAVLDAFRARVVVVDLVLPGTSGLALVQTIKADARTRDIVCIAVTVLNGQDGERAALAAGCAAYVRKPIDTDTFVALVARHLGKKS